MEINDDLSLTCMPVDLDSNPVTGSTKDVCAECQREVWVAPTSTDMIRQCRESGHEAKLLCLFCSIETGAFLVANRTPSPSQMAEMAREFFNE